MGLYQPAQYRGGRIVSVLLFEVFCLFGCFRIGSGMRLHCQIRENRLSRRNLVFNRLRQPVSRLLRIPGHSAPIGIHDPEDVHRLSITGLRQAVQAGRSFLVPADGLRRLSPVPSCVMASEAILGECIVLFG